MPGHMGPPRVAWTRLRRALTGAFVCIVMALAPAAAAEHAGIAHFVSGEVTIVRPDGTRHALRRGDPVPAVCRIETGPGARVEVHFGDGGRLQLGPETRFALETYNDGEQPAFLARVAKGVFRMVTGLIARRRREDFRVDALVATIGVRGTDFAGEVEEAGTARIVLLDPDGDGSGAIEVWNAHGRVVIEEAGFGTEVPDADSPPSPPRRMRLRSVNDLMRTLGQVQRLQTSRPPRR